jgi:hypothetical protein
MSEGQVPSGGHPLTAAQPSGDEQKAERKRLKKLEDAMETASLEPWQRYRALTDLLEHYQDLAEMADRKSRFALVILGAVNAVNLLVVARPELFSLDANRRMAWIGIYAATYFALSLFLFVQAITALKPRVATVFSPVETPEGAAHPLLGLRFVKNILDTGFEEYYQKWKQARVADINREVALHVRHLAAIVSAKYRTLHRLYAGLMALVFLTAGLIAIMIYNRLYS